MVAVAEAVAAAVEVVPRVAEVAVVALRPPQGRVASVAVAVGRRPC